MNETKYWTWHVFAGVAVLVLLGLHMITMHLDQVFAVFNPAGGRAVDWGNVLFRSKHAVMVVLYVLLLGAGLYHGLFGLRNIAHEALESAALKKVVDAGLWLCGIGLFLVGSAANIMGKMKL